MVQFVMVLINTCGTIIDFQRDCLMFSVNNGKRYQNSVKDSIKTQYFCMGSESYPNLNFIVLHPKPFLSFHVSCQRLTDTGACNGRVSGLCIFGLQRICPFLAFRRLATGTDWQRQLLSCTLSSFGITTCQKAQDAYHLITWLIPSVKKKPATELTSDCASGSPFSMTVSRSNEKAGVAAGQVSIRV